MNNLVFGVNAIYEILKMRPEEVVQIVIVEGRMRDKIDKILDLAKRFGVLIVK